jgi:hypothetical protein
MIEIGDLLYRKASELLLSQTSLVASPTNGSDRQQWIRSRLADLHDGQILFCKNNICVHDIEPEVTHSIERPGNRCTAGYFTIKVQVTSLHSEARRSSGDQLKTSLDPLPDVSLVFTWIPNTVFNHKHSDLSLESLLEREGKHVKFPGYARRCSLNEHAYDENR